MSTPDSPQTTDEQLLAFVNELKQRGNNAYCAGIDQSLKPACLGWEAKVKAGQFGLQEFQAHEKRNTSFGQSQAYYAAAQALEAVLKAWPECSICRRRHSLEIVHASE